MFRSKNVKYIYIYQAAQSSGELVLVTTPPRPRPPPTTGTLTQLIHLWKRCQHSRVHGCRSVDARPSAYPTENLRNIVPHANPISQFSFLVVLPAIETRSTNKNRNNNSPTTHRFLN